MVLPYLAVDGMASLLGAGLYQIRILGNEQRLSHLTAPQN